MGRRVSVWRTIMNVIYPRRCVFCGGILPPGTDAGICHQCMEEVPFCITKSRCADCGRPVPEWKKYCFHCGEGKRYFFEKVFAAFLYDSIVRKSIVRFKDRGFRNYAPIYAAVMAAVMKEEVSTLGIELIVAVPPRPERMRKTGYDQGVALAKALAREMKVSLCAGVLTQKENRKKQSELAFPDRWANIRGNIGAVKPEAVAGKRLLLVDDICSTGATLDECSRILRQAGARDVYGAVAAVVMEK